MRPIVVGDLAHRPQGEDPDRPLAVLDGEGVVVVAHEVVVHGRLERGISRDAHDVAGRHVAGLDPGQDPVHLEPAVRDLGGLREEPADCSKPEAADEAAQQHFEDADADEEVTEALPRPGCGAGRLDQAARSHPDAGPQQPPTVQRKPGDEVEDAQGQVEPSQAPHGEGDLVGQRVAGQHDDGPEHPRDDEAADRPDRRDQELVAGP